MSNFNYTKKCEHESAAATAVMQKDFNTAFYHISEAAKYTLALANQCTGDLAQAYLRNANQLMDIMTKPLTMENISGSKLPDAIKRSIISNPLIEQPTEDPRMNELTEKLAKGMPGIQASMKILNDLDKIDAEKKELNEERIARPKPQATIDYDVIRSIIEEVVDEKLNKFAPMLTESRGSNCSALSVMNIKNNKFLFLDDNDNIFECQMVFKGKNKVKRKK